VRESAFPPWAAAFAAALLLSGVAHSDDAPFRVQSIPTPGRTVALELADLDGDGRQDVMRVAVFGLPPDERRVLHVYLQSETGAFAPRPSFERPLPTGAAVYDVADVRPEGGEELLFLLARSVVILSLASADAPRWELPIDGHVSVAPAADERGLEPLPLFHDDLGPEPLLLVPTLDGLLLLSLDGEAGPVLDVGARANYYAPRRPALMFLESDVQLFFDFPRISVGHVDGDGRPDLVSSTRHAVRVFRQREGGGFERMPDRLVPLGLLSERDHIRGSGGLSSEARDFDGDGRLDLLVSQVSGGFSDAKTVTRGYRNRNGTWNVAEPDFVFSADGRIGTAVLVDLDGDGRPALVLAGVPLSVLELVELLLTSAFDARLAVHRPDAGQVFEKDASVEVKLDVPISFETFRTAGFLPYLHADLNADGHCDLLLGGDGEELEVRLGGPRHRWEGHQGRQELDTRGELVEGDLEGDGLPDFAIYDPQRPGSALRLLRNRGVLPGTPPRFEASDRER
jgi:hypothetical protein